jgi:hypothetical protein
MLSMVASVYELRQGVGMPATVAELYATASDAMLARGGVVTAELKQLLQRIFFEAHVAQRRLIEDRQLDEAALGLEAPEALAKIRAEAAAKMPFEPFGGRAEMGHYVEVTKEGEHKGRRGVITEEGEHMGRPWGRRGVITTDDKSTNPYKVTFADRTVSGWLQPNELRSSGQGEMAVLQRAMDASAPAVRAACEARLSVALREALHTVRERVLVDALPLLSLWQSEPLQLQSSHLSFQEYFAAIALCDEGTELSGTRPWQWPAWWANAVKLGAEIPCDRFGHGLLRAAGVTGDTLDLSQKLGGDRPTVRRALAAVVASAGELMTLNLGQNKLDAEDARALAPALTKTTLARVDVRGNKIAGDGAAQLAAAVLGNLKIEMFNGIPIKEMRADSFTELDLKRKDVGVEGGMVVAGLIPVMGGLTRVDVRSNNIVGDGAAQLSAAVLSNLKIEMFNEIPIKEMRANLLTELDLSGKDVGVEGGMVVAGLIPVMGALTSVKLRGNKIGDRGWGAISAAICGFKDSKIMSMDAFGENIGPAGVQLIAEALRTSVTGALTVTNLLGNQLDAESANLLAEVAKQKGISLCGIQRDQTTADFSKKRLQPPDAILLASDLSQAAVTGALTEVWETCQPTTSKLLFS